MSRAARRWRAAVAALALAATAATGAGCTSLRDVFAPYSPHPEEVEALLASQHLLPHYDAALVLGCPAEPDGSPSPCQQCRVATAVHSWRAGRVDAIIVSGGAAHSPLVEADVMAALAERLGVPPTAIVREGRALTTWQNVHFALALLRARHGSTLLVVSTSDHLPRARRIARFWGLDDAHAGYVACDRDLLPGDVSSAQPPTNTKG